MKMVRGCREIGLLVVCGLVLIPSRSASAVDFDVISEEVTVVEAEKAEKPDLLGPTSVYAGAQYRSSTDVKKGGAFSAPTFGAGGSLPLNLTDDIKLRLGANYRAVLYNFNKNHKSAGALGTIPWDAMNTVTLSAIAQGKINEQWAVFGGLFARASAEIDVDEYDMWTGGALLGFKYFHSETFTIGLALLFATQLEEDASFAPLPLLEWHFVEKMDLRLGPTHTGASNGYGAEWEWDFKEHWGTGVGIQIMKERFRLDNNGVGKNGIGQDTGVPIYVKLGYAVSEKVAVEFFLGAIVSGELRVETKTGKSIDGEDYKPQPFVGLRCTLGVF